MRRTIYWASGPGSCWSSPRWWERRDQHRGSGAERRPRGAGARSTDASRRARATAGLRHTAPGSRDSATCRGYTLRRADISAELTASHVVPVYVHVIHQSNGTGGA